MSFPDVPDNDFSIMGLWGIGAFISLAEYVKRICAVSPTVRNKVENNTYTMVIAKSREDSISFK